MLIVTMVVLSFSFQIAIFMIFDKRPVFFIVFEHDHFHELPVPVVALPLPDHHAIDIGSFHLQDITFVKCSERAVQNTVVVDLNDLFAAAGMENDALPVELSDVVGCALDQGSVEIVLGKLTVLQAGLAVDLETFDQSEFLLFDDVVRRARDQESHTQAGQN